MWVSLVIQIMVTEERGGNILNTIAINGVANARRKNSFVAVKTSKMLINKGMDADIDTGLQSEIYGGVLCFAHEYR